MAPSEKALKKLLLADAEGRDLTRLTEYEKVGGYESLKKALKMERAKVLDELTDTYSFLFWQLGVKVQ